MASSLDRAFIFEGLKALLPVVVCLSFLWVSGHLSSDYYFHLAYHGDGPYPPMVAWILGLVGDSARGQALFVLNLVLTTVIPYCLITRITKDPRAGWVYLYSGIPLVLFSIWFVPQAIIQCMILVAILRPEAMLLFPILGPFIHQFSIYALLLVAAFHFFRAMQTHPRFSRWLNGS